MNPSNSWKTRNGSNTATTPKSINQSNKIERVETQNSIPFRQKSGKKVKTSFEQKYDTQPQEFEL